MLNVEWSNLKKFLADVHMRVVYLFSSTEMTYYFYVLTLDHSSRKNISFLKYYYFISKPQYTRRKH